MKKCMFCQCPLIDEEEEKGMCSECREQVSEMFVKHSVETEG
jgi:hypothetical protein